MHPSLFVSVGARVKTRYVLVIRIIPKGLLTMTAKYVRVVKLFGPATLKVSVSVGTKTSLVFLLRREADWHY
jgi:hypothetical protein